MRVDAVILSQIRRGWAAAGIVHPVAASETDILRFETRYHVRVPDDLAQYFKTINGMKDDQSDAHGIHFWPLASVHSVSEELAIPDVPDHASYFVFADYSLWAHGYAIQLANGKSNDVAIVGGRKPIPIAESFGDFLLAYVHEPKRLF
jgi:hypothetical protein